MSEAPLANDAAARSPTGEITDVRDLTPKAQETTTPNESSTTQATAATVSPSTDAEGGTAKSQSEPPKPEDPKPSVVPEVYEFTAPENYTIDAALLEKATPIFKELGLTQEQAQKLVDIQVAREIENAKAPEASYTALRTEWQAATLADPDIKAYSTDGKTGIDAVKIDIGRALSSLGDTKLEADFRAAMDLTGAGDNPAFVKAFWRLAQKVGEGKHVVGHGASPEGQRAPGSAAKPSPAQAMYPNLK